MRTIDHIPEGWGMLELSNGKKYVARLNSCMFCAHCTDIFYDSSGIYMHMCDIYGDIEKGMSGNCRDFIIEDKGE